MTGTARAQYHFRQSCVFLNMHLLNRPEVMVPVAQDKIRDGKLVDTMSRDLISQLLRALIVWTERLQHGTTEEQEWLRAG